MTLGVYVCTYNTGVATSSRNATRLRKIRCRTPKTAIGTVAQRWVLGFSTSCSLSFSASCLPAPRWLVFFLFGRFIGFPFSFLFRLSDWAGL